MRPFVAAVEWVFVFALTNLLFSAESASVGSASSRTGRCSPTIDTIPSECAADHLLMQMPMLRQSKLVKVVALSTHGSDGSTIISNRTRSTSAMPMRRSSLSNMSAQLARFESSAGLNPAIGVLPDVALRDTKETSDTFAVTQGPDEVGSLFGEVYLPPPDSTPSDRMDRSAPQVSAASLMSSSSGTSKQADGRAGRLAVNPSKDRSAGWLGPLGPTPLSEEPPFDSHGASGGGAMAELRLPGLTLRFLHSMAEGSLARFLGNVRLDLSSGAQVPERRISILGLHERYQRVNPSQWGVPTHTKEEVVVRFEILLGEAGNERPEPHEALDFLKADFQSEVALQRSSGLQMSNATIEEATGMGKGVGERRAVALGMARFYAVAVPIGISAVFTGVLIWLAAA